MAVILHEYLCIFMTVSCWILVRMGNISEKKFIEEIVKGFLGSLTLFSENRDFCEIMWGNMAEPDRPQTTK